MAATTLLGMAGIYRRLSILPLVGLGGRAEDEPMFSIHCPSHGSNVLLGRRRVRVVNTTDGVALVWRCICGHEGVEILSGAGAGSARPTDRLARVPA
jgi:hypothetical protein